MSIAQKFIALAFIFAVPSALVMLFAFLDESADSSPFRLAVKGFFFGFALLIIGVLLS